MRRVFLIFSIPITWFLFFLLSSPNSQIVPEVLKETNEEKRFELVFPREEDDCMNRCDFETEKKFNTIKDGTKEQHTLQQIIKEHEIITSAFEKKEKNTATSKVPPVTTKLSQWQEQQVRRKNDLRKACRKIYNNSHRRMFMINARRKKHLFRHLVVDDNHEVLYCYIPKIACSNWKRIMMILSGKTSARDPKDKRIGNPHEPGAFYRLDSYSQVTIAKRLKSYTKFLFVRHPFERLVSAYRNKFESYANSSNKFKLDYGPQIIEGFKMGNPIPFKKFVEYVLKASKDNKPLNEHWATYNDLCHPCFLRYNYIGYYESLVEDAENILDVIGAPEDMHFPSQNTAHTAEIVEKYFSYLSNEQIKGLFDLYNNDFVLFGYNKTIKPFS
ncbi:UNVERIFIED_CONTAM: hypothetical protein RMT77_001038 [Armadillidium vulgare]